MCSRIYRTDVEKHFCVAIDSLFWFVQCVLKDVFQGANSGPFVIQPQHHPGNFPPVIWLALGVKVVHGDSRSASQLCVRGKRLKVNTPVPTRILHSPLRCQAARERHGHPAPYFTPKKNQQEIVFPLFLQSFLLNRQSSAAASTVMCNATTSTQ